MIYVINDITDYQQWHVLCIKGNETQRWNAKIDDARWKKHQDFTNLLQIISKKTHSNIRNIQRWDELIRRLVLVIYLELWQSDNARALYDLGTVAFCTIKRIIAQLINMHLKQYITYIYRKLNKHHLKALWLQTKSLL